MKNLGVAVLVSLFLASCASTSWPADANPAVISDTPDHFLVVDTATGAVSEPAGPACRNPLIDPRNGTRLTLIRSHGGAGDYLPDQLRYGLAANQLLRIRCSDGQPVGATTAPP